MHHGLTDKKKDKLVDKTVKNIMFGRKIVYDLSNLVYMILFKIAVFRSCYSSLQFCLIFWVMFWARTFNEVQYWVCLLFCSCLTYGMYVNKATVHFYIVDSRNSPSSKCQISSVVWKWEGGAWRLQWMKVDVNPVSSSVKKKKNEYQILHEYKNKQKTSQWDWLQLNDWRGQSSHQIKLCTCNAFPY